MNTYVPEQTLFTRAVHSLFEGGTKLEAEAITVATAAVLFHRFYNECDPQDYDPFLIAATSLYLAGKVEEDHLKIRDIINVFHRITEKNAEPLSLSDEYWNLRDSIVNCELLMLRMLKFKVSVNHPHRYLLHYLKSIYDWLHPDITRKVPIARTCWALLNDHYHTPLCLKHKPQHISVAIISLALQSYAVNLNSHHAAVKNWHEVFCPELSTEQLWNVMDEVMGIYDDER